MILLNNVFLLTIDEFFKTNKFINVPCIEHSQDVLTHDINHIISNFVIMQMRQYVLHTNKNKSKENAKKKSLRN